MAFVSKTTTNPVLSLVRRAAEAVSRRQKIPVEQAHKLVQGKSPVQAWNTIMGRDMKKVAFDSGFEKVAGKLAKGIKTLLQVGHSEKANKGAIKDVLDTAKEARFSRIKDRMAAMDKVKKSIKEKK